MRQTGRTASGHGPTVMGSETPSGLLDQHRGRCGSIEVRGLLHRGQKARLQPGLLTAVGLDTPLRGCSTSKNG